ncbi:MAG: AAA family ATPase [Actinomycetota bacterium]|nr:AAA family ATPase [Actinomycetota bacterium]MDA2971414.1 AAA family ATPase [Actinomycetota bacterium]MDA3002072.1 AAA family ATPase [Actinomycetota bacterium]
MPPLRSSTGQSDSGRSTIDRLFTATRLVVVAGKGGVGKTTVTAVLANAAANLGLRVLVVTLDDRPGLDVLLGGSPGDGASYDGDLVSVGRGDSGTGSIHLRTLSASEALQDYLATQGLARLAKRLVSTGVVDVVASAAPGIDDLLVLGKIKHLVGLAGPDGPHDLVLVDGPAAGHALSLLRSPANIATTVRGGPLRSQAIEVRDMLRDPNRSRLILVTLPETTPVNELLETMSVVTDSNGDIAMTLGPVVVNGVDHAPDVEELVASGSAPTGELGDAARFRATKCAVHRREVARLDDELGGAVLSLPHVARAGLTHDDVSYLADIAGSHEELL